MNSLDLLCPPFLSWGTGLCPLLVGKSTCMWIAVTLLHRYSGEDLVHKLFCVPSWFDEQAPGFLAESLKKGNVKTSCIFWAPFLYSWLRARCVLQKAASSDHAPMLLFLPLGNAVKRALLCCVSQRKIILAQFLSLLRGARYGGDWHVPVCSVESLFSPLVLK